MPEERPELRKLAANRPRWRALQHVRVFVSVCACARTWCVCVAVCASASYLGPARPCTHCSRMPTGCWCTGRWWCREGGYQSTP